MLKKCFSKCLILILFSSLSQLTHCELVILNIRANNGTTANGEKSPIMSEICAIKKNVTQNDNNVQYRLVDVTPYTGCDSIENSSMSNNAVLMRLNTASACSLEIIMKNLELNRASLAIIGLNSSIGTNLTNTNVTISPIFLPYAKASQISDFIKNYVNATVEVVQTTKDKFDFSLIIILVIAVVAVFFGSLWASYEFKQNLKAKAATAAAGESSVVSPIISEDKNDNEAKEEKKDENKKADDDPALLNVGFIGIIVLLVFVVAILLLLYFFYKYMIYVIYVIFSFGATLSMYRIVNLFLSKTKLFKWKIPKNNFPLLKKQPIIMDIVVAILLTGVCVVWFVFRQENWSWTIQNVLALSLAINSLSFYRLSSYKTVTIILVLFFVYDVFMVFVTPLITKGTSIMEAVAFGGRDINGGGGPRNELDFNATSNDYNRLPVVIVIPRLSKITHLCYSYLEYPFSLLGLGDILIPGLSVNYAILFDLASNNRIKVYFIANIFAYALGLFLAFIGLIFMEKAQPALFYLCPTHLLITYLVALLRKEVKTLWSGECIGKYASKESSIENEPKPTYRSDSLENIVEQHEQSIRINATGNAQS